MPPVHKDHTNEFPRPIDRPYAESWLTRLTADADMQLVYVAAVLLSVGFLLGLVTAWAF